MAVNVIVGCMQDEFKRLQAVDRTLAKLVSLTSTDAAAAWNQASIPPPPLPAAEDPECVDPSDTFPSAVVSGAVEHSLKQLQRQEQCR